MLCNDMPALPGLSTLSLRVEQWDERDAVVEEVLALCSNAIVARGAFEAAVKLRPGRIIILRQRAHVVADSRGNVRSLRKPGDDSGEG